MGVRGRRVGKWEVIIEFMNMNMSSFLYHGRGRGGRLPVVSMYIFYVNFFGVLIQLLETALLPWDFLCSPGRIA